MGLSQGPLNIRNNVEIRPWLILALLLLLAALALLGDPARAGLRYDREAIAAGEVWRLLSGHFVHLGWSHVALNGLGLMLIGYLVMAEFVAWQWLLITAAAVAGIDLGFWYLQPQLAWYVGLSGLLHAWLAAGTVRGIAARKREFWFIGAFLAGKLLYEQCFGALPGSEGTTGGPVVVAAHLYGALSGTLAALGLGFRKWRDPAI